MDISNLLCLVLAAVALAAGICSALKRCKINYFLTYVIGGFSLVFGFILAVFWDAWNYPLLIISVSYMIIGWMHLKEWKGKLDLFKKLSKFRQTIAYWIMLVIFIFLLIDLILMWLFGW